MRHLWSLLAGVVVAPLTWCLVALGQSGSQEQIGDWVKTNAYDTVDLIEPAAYLVVAGVLLGLIATLRISPLGPLVGGLMLNAAYIGMFIAPLDVRDAVPNDWELLGRDLLLRLPLDNGTLALIGMLLLISVFSTSRWRGLAATDAAASQVPVAEPDESPGDEPSDELTTVPHQPAIDPTKAEPTGDEPVPAVLSAKSAKAKRGRTKESNESPWSAPPGQSRPEKA